MLYFYRILLIVCVCVLPTAAQAQSFTVFDADASDFPLVRAKFYALDSNGRSLRTVAVRDFTVTENGVRRFIKNVIMPSAEPEQALSAVLTVDVSGSMVQNDRIDIARTSAAAWIEAMSLDDSECALSSFDDKAYFNQDFTHDRFRLLSAAYSLHPMEGTSYDKGFLDRVAGGINVARRGKNKRILVFLTDGLGGGSEAAVVKAALRDSVTVHCVTLGMDMPTVLKNIATRTGGTWHQNVTDKDDLVKIYRMILHEARKTPVGEIVWESVPACAAYRTAQISFVNPANKQPQAITDNTDYNAPPTSLIRLVAIPRSITFKDIAPGNTQGAKVTLTAERQPITVTAIESNNSVFFISRLDVPFTLQAGEKFTFTIGFVPKDSSRQFGRVDVKTNACAPTPIYLTGGYIYRKGSMVSPPTLTLTAPNGGEAFYAGADTLATWSGIMPSDAVRLEYSTNAGLAWQTSVSRTNGLKHTWRVPAVAGQKDSAQQVWMRASQIWEPQELSDKPSLVLDGHSGSVMHAEFSPDGTKIVTASADKTARVWDANTGMLIGILPHPAKVNQALFHPNGVVVATVDDLNAVRIWNAENGQYITGITPTGSTQTYDLMRLSGQRNSYVHRVSSMAFDPAGKYLATTLDQGLIVLWRLPNLTFGKFFMLDFAGAWYNVAFSPDGSHILTSSASGAQYWSVSSSTEESIKDGFGNRRFHLPDRSFIGHTGEVYHGSFSPDGTRIVTAGADKTARIWNVRTGKILLILKGHTGVIWSAAFSPDGMRVLTASSDGTLRIWDADSGMLLATIANTVRGPLSGFHHAAFNPDASRVVAASIDTDGKVWDIGGGFLQKDVSDAPFTVRVPRAAVQNISVGSAMVGFSTDTTVNTSITNLETATEAIVRVQDIRLLNDTTASAEFSLISQLPPFDIPAGTSRPLEFHFTPAMRGERTATMEVITFTDTLRSVVRGIGVVKTFDTLTALVNMGDIRLRQSKDTNCALLRNTGDVPMTITRIRTTAPDTAQFHILDIALSGDSISSAALLSASMPSVSAPLILPPHSSVSVSVRFTPQRTGRTTGGIAFEIASVQKPVVVQFAGEGTASNLTASLSASIVDESGNERAIIPTRDTVRVEEFRSIVTRPLLNYVFFEENSAQIPPRYLQLTRDSVKISRPMLAHQNISTFQLYYNVLNLLGDYLNTNPTITVRLVGCNADIRGERNGMELSRQRTLAVKQYFTTVWGINERRIKIQARNKPDRASNSQTEDGMAENRRVEILLEPQSTISPVIEDNAYSVATPETIRFQPVMQSDDGIGAIASWSIDILSDGRVIRELHGTDATVRTVDYRLLGEELNTLKSMVETNKTPKLEYRLRVSDKNGQVVRTQVASLPLRFVTRDQKRQIAASDAQFDRYSLMFFDFDKTTVSQQNIRMAEQIREQIRRRLQPETMVTITGYTDRVGDADYNRKLSDDRAKAVAELMRLNGAKIVGAGESPFLFDNDLPEGRFYCRMVEITVKTPVVEPLKQ